MTSFLTRLKGLLSEHSNTDASEVRPTPHLHVVAPDSVTLPFPRASREEICVPASINGRDLSTGRF